MQFQVVPSGLQVIQSGAQVLSICVTKSYIDH